MDRLSLWARDGEAVRQAIELGEIAHMETASEEFTDEFLLVLWYFPHSIEFSGGSLDFRLTGCEFF